MFPIFVIWFLLQNVVAKTIENEKVYSSVMDRIAAANQADKKSLPNGKQPEHQNIQWINEKQHLNLFEGDIVLDPEEDKRLGRNDRTKRNSLRRRYEIWTSRVVPYYIPSYMGHIRSNVLTAIADFHKYTCIRFVPYAGHTNYIEFIATKGCSSKVGKMYAETGAQYVSIGKGCNNVGTILHELMHALGFFHEQARDDRDKYVKIYWDNILEGRKNQFNKYNDFTIDKLGKQYDYESIMHYGRLTFSKNGKPTIVRINNEKKEFGRPDDRLSTLDIAEINELYDCSATTSYGWAQWSSFTPCDKSCYKSRQRYCYHPGSNKQYCGGNVNVYGSEIQTVKCSRSVCPIPVDGNWGPWGSWNQCSKTCGDGHHKRTRTCSNPAPKHGGKACTGSSIEYKVCTVSRCHLDYDDTEFERTLGMWKNSANDKLDWQLLQWFTQTGGTGPNGDHTTGSGYYLYMESSTPRKASDNAKLVSPWLAKPSAGGQCLKFYYSMNGKTMGSLRVKLEENGGASWLIFDKSGHQSDQWRKGLGNINTDKSYRITFEATIGQPGYSDIAIDDVYIDTGLCDCQDEYVTCSKWASSGECTTNRVWMQKNCKRSCNICGCKDKNSGCSRWASTGECQKNPNFMLVNCISSCNVCACHDDHTSCSWWANNGECTKNPTYMHDKCKRSCKVCT